jgi:hypothetical protein
MTGLVLCIPWPTPSLNTITNRRSRWAYRTIRTRWMRRVSDAYLEARAAQRTTPGSAGHWPTPPHGRVRVTIERFARQADALDQDNFLGGLKPVLDALRALSLIDDDRAAAIELVAEQRVNPYRTPAMWTQIRLDRLERD